MEDGEGDEANCNGGIFVDTGGVTVNGGFGGGGSGKDSSPRGFNRLGQHEVALINSFSGLVISLFLGARYAAGGGGGYAGGGGGYIGGKAHFGWAERGR